jgi:hypothetical protein
VENDAQVVTARLESGWLPSWLGRLVRDCGKDLPELELVDQAVALVGAALDFGQHTVDLLVTGFQAEAIEEVQDGIAAALFSNNDVPGQANHLWRIGLDGSGQCKELLDHSA